MRYGSVCSGIEAATVAWHPLGWKPVFFAEIDKFPSAVLKHHYADVPNAGDFTAIQEGDYDAIDALVGGTPCQDFSVAGLRAGMDGQRGQLTVEYAHLAHRLGPRWLVWENVPGVLSIDGGEAFATFLGLLAGVTVKVPRGGWQNSGVIAGAPGSYGLAYRVLDAQHFGVPQRRRRVFVVGYLGDWRRSAAVLFERHSLSGHPAPSREAGKGFTHELAPSLTGSGRGTERTGESRGQDPVIAVQTASTGDIAHCLNAGGMGRQDYETETETVIVTHAIQNALRGADQNGLGVSEDDVMYTLDQGSQHAVAFAQNTRDEVRLFGGDGQTVGALTAEPGMKQQSYVAIGWSEELTASIDLAGTVQRGGDGGRHEGVMTPAMAVRRLTPRECERLQGFPDDYTKISDKTADGPRYKALGNSFPVPVIAWIGERIQMVEAIVNV